MPNPNRDRGIRAEREACRELERVLGWPADSIVRRKNEGVPEDIGDVIGRHGALDGLTVQVSVTPKTPATIWQRAREKTAACTAQQQRAGNPHGLTLLKIDGGTWRALLTAPQLAALRHDQIDGDFPVTPGLVVHLGPAFLDGWVPLPCGLHVSTLEQWAHDWNNRTPC